MNSQFVEYNPKIHTGLQVYTIGCEEHGDAFVTKFVPVERVGKVGNYYVRIDEQKAIKKVHIIVKGGPGSGFRGHSGRPGLVGGSQSETNNGGVKSNGLRVMGYREGKQWREDDDPYVPTRFVILGDGTVLSSTNTVFHTELYATWIEQHPERYTQEQIDRVEETWGWIEKEDIESWVMDKENALSLEVGNHNAPDTIIVKGLEGITGSQVSDLSTKVSLMNNLFKRIKRTFEDNPTYVGKYKKVLIIGPFDSEMTVDEFWEAKGFRLVQGETIDVIKELNVKKVRVVKGGPGSGHFGHRGRPNEVGGSLPGKGSTADIGPFTDREKYNLAYNYITAGGWLKDEAKSRKGIIHREGKNVYDRYEMVQMYAKDYKAAEQGMDVTLRGRFDKDGNYIEGEKIHLSAEEFKHIQDQVTAEREARLEGLREKLGLPENYKDFVKEMGIDPNEDFWKISREEMLEREEYLHQKASEMMADEDYRDFTNKELETYIWEKYNAQMEADGINPYESTLNRMNDHLSDWHTYETRHGIAKGEITPEYGFDILGVRDAKNPQGREWEQLPDTLYHATTNAEAIISDQIRSRMEIGQRMGLGLGGGEDDTISFGTDIGIVKNIERSLHEAHLVANGTIGIKEMFDAARAGAGTQGKNYVNELLGFMHGSEMKKRVPDDWDPFDENNDDLYADEIRRLARETETRRDRLWDFYNYTFLKGRASAGGYEDPIFFGTDWKGLAKANPANFATLVYAPKRGARGYQMAGLSEWRTVGGDVVKFVKMLNFYLPDDIKAILGYGE